MVHGKFAPTRCVALALVFLVASSFRLIPSAAQDRTPESLDLFLDCSHRCDIDYIKREISYVNYVRDRTEADVHLLVTTERTGGGGRDYTLNFLGRRRFATLSDTLHYISGTTDTSDETRNGLTRKMKEGLVRYIAHTRIADRLKITVEGVSDTAPVTANPADDPWNSWVFGVNTSGSYRAEESSNNLNLRGGFNANRVTEAWKIRFRLSGNLRESNFNVRDQTVTSRTEDGSAWAVVVKSLNDNWSAGSSVFASTSSRRNQSLSVSFSPTVEYNIFPYSQSNQREIRFQYRMSLKSVNYNEITIFDKTTEKLLQQAFEIQLEFQEPWGSADASVEARNYLTDFEQSLFDLYSLDFGGSINVRVVRGLSVNVGASYESIHDQIYLPKKEASEEDILLGTIRLPTSFQFGMNFGIIYSFGSIYNNVVNPRFGF